MAETKKALVERLFAEHSGALRNFFYRRLHNRPDSAELTQEVYLRILRMRDTDAIRSPQVYLYTVASNLVKEHALLDRRAAARVEIDELSVQEQLGELTSLESELDASRQTQRVREVLAQLPLNWRTAVISAGPPVTCAKAIASAKLPMRPRVRNPVTATLPGCPARS